MPELEKMQAKTENGKLRINAGPDQWIEFTVEGWTFPRRHAWANSGDYRAILMAVEWAENWHIFDVNGALLPLDKKAMLENPELLNIDAKTQLFIIRAVTLAFSEAMTTPLVSK